MAASAGPTPSHGHHNRKKQMAIEGLGKCPLCWKQIHEMTPIDNVSLGVPKRSWVCHKECKKKWLADQEKSSQTEAPAAPTLPSPPVTTPPASPDTSIVPSTSHQLDQPTWGLTDLQPGSEAETMQPEGVTGAPLPPLEPEIPQVVSTSEIETASSESSDSPAPTPDGDTKETPTPSSSPTPPSSTSEPASPVSPPPAVSSVPQSSKPQPAKKAPAKKAPAKKAGS